MTDQSVLRHGSARKLKTYAPRFGEIFEVPGMHLSAVPARLFEVNFKTDCDNIGLTSARMAGVGAFDSDKRIRRELPPFRSMFHPAGSRTYMRTDAMEGVLFNLSIDTRFRMQFAEETGNKALAGDLHFVDNIRLSTAHTTLLALRQLFASEYNRSKMAGEAVGLLMLTNVLAGLGDAALVPPRQALSDASLARVFDMIENQLATALGVSDLAAEAGLSTYHFARSFKMATGLAPHQYVMERRVARAKERLSTGEPLADVAYGVGFSSQAHMTDVFRKKLGVTPGKYRDEVCA